MPYPRYLSPRFSRAGERRCLAPRFRWLPVAGGDPGGDLVARGQRLLAHLVRRDGVRHLGADPLLLGAELADGDLTDRRGDGVDLLRLGDQRHQVGDRDLLQQAHREDGALGVGAEDDDTVVGQDVRVAAGAELLAHRRGEESGARRGVVDDRDLAAQEPALLVRQRGDGPSQVRQCGSERLMGVHDRVHVGTLAVDRRVQGGLHGGCQRRRAVHGDRVTVEVDDTDVLGAHLLVAVVARRDRVQAPAGDADGDVALRGLQEAALEQGSTHGHDVLATGRILHNAIVPHLGQLSLDPFEREWTLVIIVW